MTWSVRSHRCDTKAHTLTHRGRIEMVTYQDRAHTHRQTDTCSAAIIQSMRPPVFPLSLLGHNTDTYMDTGRQITGRQQQQQRLRSSVKTVPVNIERATAKLRVECVKLRCVRCIRARWPVLLADLAYFYARQLAATISMLRTTVLHATTCLLMSCAQVWLTAANDFHFSHTRCLRLRHLKALAKSRARA